MRLIAFAFMSFVVFSVGHAAKAQDDMTCETVAEWDQQQGAHQCQSLNRSAAGQLPVRGRTGYAGPTLCLWRDKSSGR